MPALAIQQDCLEIKSTGMDHLVIQHSSNYYMPGIVTNTLQKENSYSELVNFCSYLFILIFEKGASPYMPV